MLGGTQIVFLSQRRKGVKTQRKSGLPAQEFETKTLGQTVS